jgi:sugar phosphate isomerase/epimerase
MLSLENACTVISALDISAVDVGALKGYAHLDPDEIEADPDSAVDQVLRAVEGQALAVSDFFPSFGAGFGERPINHPDPEVRKANCLRFQTFVDVACRIGSPGVTLLPGIFFPDLGEARSLELAASAFRELCSIAHDAGLRLSFEAHLGSVLDTPEQVLEFLERVPGLAVTLDCSHFIAKHIPVERIYPLFAKSGHVHFRQARPGRVQAGAAEGILDPVDITCRLLACGYSGTMTIEYTWQDWEGCKNVDVISESLLVRDLVRPLL